MTATIPPITEALEDYRIDPENVWVVFVASSPDARARGRPPITQPLFLADPGEAGRQQIEAIEAGDPYYLGSLSLIELKEALKSLGEQPVLEVPPGAWASFCLRKPTLSRFCCHQPFFFTRCGPPA